MSDGAFDELEGEHGILLFNEAVARLASGLDDDVELTGSDVAEWMFFAAASLSRHMHNSERAGRTDEARRIAAAVLLLDAAAVEVSEKRSGLTIEPDATWVPWTDCD